jgi:catechol 2,3-dioxygenase-like lactoylglutathione lyase family enzyme
MKEGPMIGKLRTVMLDAADITALSEFYIALAGWTRVRGDDEWIVVTTQDGWRLAFQRALDHVPPRWPDPAYPQQGHLDLRVPDLEAGTERAVALGASLLSRNETWYTLADPAGHPFDLCLKADDPNTTLMGVTLDCPDAAALSAFYAELLGKPVTYQADGMAMIGDEGAQPVLFQQVDEYAPPRWPDPAHPQQLHFDVRVEEIEAAERAALAIGATRLPGEGENWRVYADPAGKPFCLVWGVE